MEYIEKLMEDDRLPVEAFNHLKESFLHPQNFGRFYRDAFPLWEKGEGPRPMMIQDIPSILSKKRGVPDHRVVYYLLMDGMRWDLWESIKRASHPPICQCDQLSQD